MSKENECYAYFTVVGEFDPATVTQRVSVEPTEAWRKGDLNPRSDRERKFSRWSLRSRLATTQELENHVVDVLDQLDLNPDAFKEISSSHGGWIQLVGYFNSIGVGLHFESNVIQRLSQYRLSVDCDFYYLYSDAREDNDS